jgi:hypothetical protein
MKTQYFGKIFRKIITTFRLTSLVKRRQARVRVQALFRGYMARKKFKLLKIQNVAIGEWFVLMYRMFNSVLDCLVPIQALVRGALVRSSERYILAQLYLKMPPFWRSVMNSVPTRRVSLQNLCDEAL